MRKHVLVFTISAFVLASGATAIAQGPMMPRVDQQQTQGQDGSTGQGKLWGAGRPTRLSQPLG